MSVPLRSAAGRGALAASILGSGMAFLDGTVVNVALPAIGKALHTDLAGLQWTVDAYLLTLTAFLLIGGSLGDRLGRARVFSAGVVGFLLASMLCALAPSAFALTAARALQGVAGALLVPLSLALVRVSIREEDQGQALGIWTGLSGVTSAAGPLVGGWLVSAVSWRAIFFLNIPLGLVALWVARRSLPTTADARSETPLDGWGALTAALSVGGLTYAIIEGPAHGWTLAPLLAALLSVAAMVVFLRLERRPEAMMPLALFKSPAFSAANGATLLLYAALGSTLFLLMLELQMAVGMSPIAAGLMFLPLTLLMLVLSPRAGQWAQKHGARWPMATGALIAAVAFVAFLRIAPGVGWASGGLPGVLLLGVGLSTAVAPLTMAVLDAAPPEHAGIASGVNNAVARLAGLLGVAAIPWAAGLAMSGPNVSPQRLTEGFHRAMWVCAGLCLAAAVVSALWVPGRAVSASPQASEAG
jgi:EmrB/QacA subfamily drug resistance transporter